MPYQPLGFAGILLVAEREGVNVMLMARLRVTVGAPFLVVCRGAIP